MDSGNGSVVWYSIVSQDSPFVVDRDTGVITTAGVFRGQSGMTLQVQVRAFDNFGIPPTQSTTATLSVSIAYHFVFTIITANTVDIMNLE